MECAGLNISPSTSPFFLGVRCSLSAHGPHLLKSCYLLVYTATVDIVLAILPWPIIWSLQMTRKEKAGVAVAMSMGFMYAACPSDSAVADILQ